MISWLSFHRPKIIAAPARQQASRWPLIGLTMGAAWLAMFLYADTLSLPFFQDDVAHIRWLAQFDSPFTPFLTATGIPAYRPLGEMLLKMWYMLLGRHDAAWLRFLNISMHIINCALVAAVAVRIDRPRTRYWTAGLAAVLFAVLPFAYQAVPWINVFYYPLNNLLQLSMVLVYWEARQRGSNKLLALALFLGAISPLEIEYGLMSGGLLLAVEIALLLKRRQKAIWLGGPLLVLALNIVFLVVWLLVPKSAYEFGPPTLERLMQISFYFLQGLTYPLSPLALALMNATGLGDLTAIAIVTLPILLLVIVLLLRQRRRALLAMSLIWFAALNLPGFLTLTFDYVINSPRLMYPVGPSMAWLWAGFFTTVMTLSRRRIARPVLIGLAGAVLLIVIGLNINFVRIRMAHYHIVEGSMDQLGEIARETPADESLLVVNMPAWITPEHRLFALGNNGIQFIPFYVSIEDVIYAINDRDHPTQAVQFHNLRQPQPYYYGMHGARTGWEDLHQYLDDAGDVYLTEYSPDRVDLARAGSIQGIAGNGGVGESAGQTFFFDERIKLTLLEHEMLEDSLSLRLVWQLIEPVPEDLTVFVHLYGPNGELLNQDDGYPLRGLSPFWLWGAGQILEDQRRLSVPLNGPVGELQVGVGLYDPASGSRVPAFSADGQRQQDDAARLLYFSLPPE